MCPLPLPTVEIKAPADKFQEDLGTKNVPISNICPDKVASCELLEGDWGKEDSVIFRNHFLGN